MALRLGGGIGDALDRRGIDYVVGVGCGDDGCCGALIRDICSLRAGMAEPYAVLPGTVTVPPPASAGLDAEASYELRGARDSVIVA